MDASFDLPDASFTRTNVQPVVLWVVAMLTVAFYSINRLYVPPPLVDLWHRQTALWRPITRALQSVPPTTAHARLVNTCILLRQRLAETVLLRVLKTALDAIAGQSHEVRARMPAPSSRPRAPPALL